VRPAPWFDGHEACSPNGEYINAIIGYSSSGSGTTSLVQAHSTPTRSASRSTKARSSVMKANGGRGRRSPPAKLLAGMVVVLALASCAKGNPAERARFQALWRDPMFQVHIPGGSPGQLIGHAASSYQTGDPLLVLRTWTVPAVTPTIFADALIRERRVGLSFGQLYCDHSFSVRGVKHVENFWVDVTISLDARPTPTLRVTADGGQLPPHATQTTPPPATTAPPPSPTRTTPSPTALPPLPSISGNCPQTLIHAAGLG